MTVTREDWQSDLLDKTQDVMPKLKQMGITSGYHIIAAAALLPILIAGPGWFPLLVSLVGSVGANLIANQIQGAKDELDIARKLQGLPDDHPLNVQVKLLLEKLDAVNVVSQGLPESDWVRLERLLDEKFAQMSTSPSREPAVSAPIIREIITSAQVRQIAQQHFTNIWWANKTHGKSNVALIFVPTVLYRARCSAVVQVSRKDQYGNYLDKTKVTTDPFPIKLILFREEGRHKSDSLVQGKLFQSINGLSTSNEIDWPENSFAGWGYSIGAVLIRRLSLHPPSSDGIRDAEKNIGFWFGSKSRYETKPSTLIVQKEKIIDDARLAIEEILEKWYNRTSEKILLRARFSDEALDFAQYPFYFLETTSPGSARIVIDGLTGDVRYSCLKPNLKAQVIYSAATFFMSLAILLFLFGISVLAIRILWK